MTTLQNPNHLRTDRGPAYQHALGTIGRFMKRLTHVNMPKHAAEAPKPAQLPEAVGTNMANDELLGVTDYSEKAKLKLVSKTELPTRESDQAQAKKDFASIQDSVPLLKIASTPDTPTETAKTAPVEQKMPTIAENFAAQPKLSGETRADYLKRIASSSESQPDVAAMLSEPLAEPVEPKHRSDDQTPEADPKQFNTYESTHRAGTHRSDDQTPESDPAQVNTYESTHRAGTHRADDSADPGMSQPSVEGAQVIQLPVPPQTPPPPTTPVA